MPGKKPKKTPEHEHDDIAYRNLKDVFGNWNIERGGAEKSGIEYGKDWRVEIVRDDGEVTGFEFWIQSKVLRGKKALTKNDIGDSIKVTTLNYLYDLPTPVLLHLYHKPTKTAYFIWLKPWYVEATRRFTSEEWEKTKKARVNVPRTNVFNSQALEHIRNEIELFYFRQGIHNTANIINETSKDYFIEATYYGEQAAIIINPLHEGAIAALAPLDEKAARSLERAEQTGLPTPLSGKFGLANVPRLLLGNPNSMSMMLISNFEDTPHFPLRIQFLTEAGEYVHQDYVEDIAPVQNGTHIKSWEGKAYRGFLIYKLTIIFVPERRNLFHFEYDITQTNPLVLNQYYSLIEELARAKQCRLVDPRVDRIVGEDNFDVARDFNSGSTEIRRMAKALATIAIRAKLLINMPKEFDDDDLLTAEGIARILETGQDQQLIGLPKENFNLVLDVPIALARELTEEHEKVGNYSRPGLSS